eukprot:SAG22_NODE_69_length_22779_cov_71.088139_7_plen_82_part_00
MRMHIARDVNLGSLGPYMYCMYEWIACQCIMQVGTGSGPRATAKMQRQMRSHLTILRRLMGPAVSLWRPRPSDRWPRQPAG